MNFVVRPAYAPASEEDEEELTARADQQRSGALDPWIDAGVQLGLAIGARGKDADEEAGTVAKTQFGWTGSPSWRRAANELDEPGDHETVGGRIPTEEEAVRMIAHNGGAVDRIEPSHRPGGVSSHTYDHINYYTSSGDKAAVQVILSPKVEAD